MHEIILSKYFQYSSICLRCCLHFWWHRKYLPILILRDWCLVARRVSVCFMRSRLRIFFFNKDTSKNEEISRRFGKLWRFDKKSLSMRATKTCSWIQKRKNISYSDTVNKTCSYRWKFQRTLKSNVFFILKHIVIYLTHSIQLA